VEAMMKALLMSVLTVALLAAATPSHAQSSGGDQNKGVTNGWGGGTKDQSTPGGGNQGAEVHDEAEAQNQPAMATGLDLNGPPMKFPPSKTPE
jgi:hypothetical protein